MEKYEFIFIVILIIIIIFFIFNKNDNNCKKENFDIDSYVFLEGLNSKHTLKNYNTKKYKNDINELSKICDKLDNCAGFTNDGELKYSNDLYKDPSSNKPTDGIYIKKKYNCNFEDIIKSKLPNLPQNIDNNISPSLQGIQSMPTKIPISTPAAFSISNQNNLSSELKPITISSVTNLGPQTQMTTMTPMPTMTTMSPMTNMSPMTTMTPMTTMSPSTNN